MIDAREDEAKAAADGPIALAVVIPVFQESANVAEMARRLAAVLEGVAWEAIFVDDNSPDGTADAARALARTDRRIRVIERVGRRGLASAVIEGMLATAAPLVAVIDGDLQHDEALLPRMLAALEADPALDLAIGSRFVAGGSDAGLSDKRAAQSRLATRLSRGAIGADLKDPMSGFFMARIETIREVLPRLSAIGFKILLDIFTSARRPLKFVELPYAFRSRGAGASKLDRAIAFEYLVMLYDKAFGRIVPARFALFSAIGALGVAVHFAFLTAMFQGANTSFAAAQAVATLGAMTFNFVLNNALTYRDRQLRGPAQLLKGWLSFCVVCSVGALANVGVATWLFETRHALWTLSALAGIAVGAVWNFALSSRFTWSRF